MGAEFEPYDEGPEADVLAYKHTGATPAENLIVLLNFGSHHRQVRLMEEDLLPQPEGSSVLEDLLTGERVKFDARRGVVPLRPDEGVILRMRRSDEREARGL